ncbi:unnamed protein product [Symbiodinium sp. CCMP2592]|nr:unnamed protein product [Symbiodinium sp. CCMP2592]
MCRASANFCQGCGEHWQKVAVVDAPDKRQKRTEPWDQRGQGYPRGWRQPRERTGPSASPRRRGGGKGGHPKGTKSAEQQPGKGKQGHPTGAPDVGQLPAPPKTGKPNKPPPSDSQASSSAPSEDRRMLEQLMAQLSITGTELPAGVATMVTQFQAENHRLHGRQLHQLVAKQTAARKEIARLEQEASTFEKAWTTYMEKLSQLIEQQMEERQQHVAAREAALSAWHAQLTEATNQLAAQAGATSTGEADMDTAEDMVNQAIEDEAEQCRAREQANLRFQAMLQMLQQQPGLVKGPREGSRTPRRRKGDEAETISSRDASPSGRDGTTKVEAIEPGDAKASGGKGEPSTVGVVPWSHSVHSDPSCVSPFLAQLIALQAEFDVATDSASGVFQCLVDDRIEIALEQPVAAYLDPLDGVVSSQAGWDSFRIPKGRMGKPLVESEAESHLAKTETALEPDVPVGQLPVSECSRLTLMSPRYVAFSTTDHATVRSLPGTGSLDEIIFDLVTVFPGLRSVKLLQQRLVGYPAAQFAIATREDLPASMPVPLDFRPLQGRVCTVALEAGWDASRLRSCCLAACPSERLPVGSFEFLTPKGEPFHEVGDQVFDFLISGGAVVSDTDAAALMQLTCAPSVSPGSLLKGYAAEPGRNSLVKLREPRDFALHQAKGRRVPLLVPSGPAASKDRGVLRPTEVAFIRAARAMVFPPDLDGTALYFPLERIIVELRPSIDSQGRGRYTVFEPGARPRVRACGADWVLGDFAADAAGSATFSVRAIQFITRPIAGYPIPQVILSPASAPVNHFAVVFDLRCQGLDVVTASVPPVLPLQELEPYVAAGAPIPSLMRFRQGPPLALIDSAGQRHLAISAPLAQYEWVVLQFVMQDQDMPVTVACSESEAARLRDPGRTLRNTLPAPEQTRRREAVLPGDPPPSAHTRRMANPTARPTCECFPTEMFDNEQGVAESLQFALETMTGRNGAPCFPFTVFAWHQTPRRLTAGLSWTLHQLALAAQASAWDDATRAVHVLQCPLQGFASPQLVLTPVDVTAPWRVLPVDLRPLGGLVFPIPVEPEMHMQDVLESIVPFTTTDVAVQLRLQGHEAPFLQDQFGAVLISLPTDLSQLDWAVVRPRRGGPALGQSGVSTTSTTTLMRLREDETLSFALVHGPKVLRTSPLVVRSSRPELALALLVGTYARQTRLPDAGTVQLTQAFPLREEGRFLVPFVLTSGFEEMVAVIIDTTLNGRGMYSVEAPIGTWPEQLLTQAQKDQELTFLVNGLPMQAMRRPIETGDYLQLVHVNALGQPSVTPATYLMHCVQSLRLWSLPVAFPPLTHVKGPLGTALAERNNRAFLRFFEELATRRTNIFGRFGTGCNSLWLLSARHPPFQFAIESPYRPTLEEAQEVFRASGIFTDADRVTEAERAISIAGTAFVRFRDDDVFLTVLMPAPLQPEFFHTAAISPTAPRVAYSLLVPSTSAPEKAARTRPRPASLSGSLSLLQTKARLQRVSVATPFGRRALPALAAGTRDLPTERTVQRPPTTKVKIELCSLLPEAGDSSKIAPGEQGRHVSVRFGATLEMFDFVFAPFRAEIFDLDWGDVPGIQQCSSDFVKRLPKADRGSRIEALQLFVDGSYFPDQGEGARAGWAIVALGLQQGTWCWIGVCATSASVAGSANTFDTPVESCFEAELAAIGYALAVAIAMPVPVLIGYDSTSAGDLAQGFAAASQQTALSDAVVSLAHLLDVLGRRPRYLHIRSHLQRPLNELADQAAKGAARHSIQSGIPETLADSVKDGVLKWLWVAIGASPSIPALNSNGCMTDATPSSAGPSLETVLGDPPHRGEGTLRFKVCTYNCLSLASQAQKESLSRQFLQLGLSIICLQETRCSCAARQHLPDFHILGSDSHQGQLGCQIWFSKKVAVGTLNGDKLHWDPTGFSVALRRPRLLLAFARLGCFRIAIILNAHAPTSRATACERREWWAALHQAFAMIPCNCVPLVCIDANARLACPSGNASDNISLFQGFLRRHELEHSDYLDKEGRELATWISPNGHGACIDYVLFPRAIGEGVRSLGPATHFEGIVDHDHRPVIVALDLRQKVSRAAPQPRLDLQFLRTPQGRHALSHLLHGMPAVPWETGVDDHLAAINTHISKGLAAICPKLTHSARRPTTSEATWLCIRHRRELRRDCHRQRLLSQQSLLQDCFQTWAAGMRVVTVDTHLQGLHQGLLSLQINAASRSVARLAKQDAAAATKQLFQEAHQQGPESLFRLFKGVMKAGRGYKKPNLSPALLLADGSIAQDSQTVLGQHFAAAERATSIKAADIRTKPAREECTVLQAIDSICLPRLAHAFGSMATRKASGLSGVPSEIFRFAPGQAAAVHIPLILKMMMRCQSPLLWRGGRAAPIEKPGKSLTTPGGWRSIMLMEAGAKGLGGALRQELLRGFEAVRVEGQVGSRPNAPMQTAMSQVRGFLTELHDKRRSGGVVFVDGQTAFYATIRQGLVGCDADSTLEYLSRLACILFHTEEARDRFIASALAQDSLPDAMCSQKSDAFETHTGTTPGAPLADLAFQYVFATTLAKLRDRLAEIGCSARVGVHRDIQVPAPTWMDDLAVPFATAFPAEVIPTASRILSEVAEAFCDIGIAINWGQGKSELLPIFYGPGARSQRTQWCASEGATFPVALPGGASISAHITPAYIHLGSLADIKGGDAEDIRRRRLLARELQAPLMKLLCNPFLEAREKVDLLLSMPVARFKHGAGLWRLEKKREKEAFHAGYMELLRRAFRPIVGCSTKGLQDEDICDGLGVLNAEELRAIEVLRHAAWLWADGSESIQALWFQEGPWFEEVRAAARRCVPASSRCTDPWGLLAGQPRLAKNWIRNYVKQRRTEHRARGELLLPLWQSMDSARQHGWIFCTFSGDPHADNAHQCPVCAKTFRTAAAAAAHSSKAHGNLAKARLLANGSKCEVCSVEFWSTHRLIEHLRRSPDCLHVLDSEDLEATEISTQKHHFAWPPAAVSLGARSKELPTFVKSSPARSAGWTVFDNWAVVRTVCRPD